MKKEKAITLISLVITIIILIILAGVAINLSLGNNGIFTRAKEAKEATNKQEATEIINLKITNCQINKYAEKQEMPTLQELADVLYEDDEIQYVALESKVGDKEKVTVGSKTSIFTKLNKYPYEFEINGSLQLASINGVKISQNNNSKINILWENPDSNGTTAFAEQTVELSSNEYDCLEIFYKNVTIGGGYYVERIYKGYSTQITHINAESPSLAARGVAYIDDTHILFQNCYLQGTIDNRTCIPLKITGYKY